MSEEKQNLRDLSDEELDSGLEDKGTSAEETIPEPDDQNRIEMEEGQESEGTSDKETISPEDKDQIPEWVPENLRDHYKNKNVDELVKSVTHFQQQASKYGNYNALFDLMEADPSIRSAVIRAASGQSPVEQTSGQQTDPNKVIYEKLEQEGLGEVAEAMKGMQTKISQLESNWQGSNQEEIQYLNTQALQGFGDKYKLPQDQMNQIILNTERHVRPGGRKGEYTVEDLEAAYFRIDPAGFRQRIVTEERTKMSEALRNANNNDESNQGVSANAQHDPHVNAASKALDSAKSPEEFQDRLSELSDEELDEDLNKHGMKSFTPWRPGTN